jgi:hypothetical protein
MLDYANNLVPSEARAADLIVVGRPADPADLHYAHDPGVTVLRAGRPVLFVPDAIESLHARRVVIAWKDSRESRRAVRDALPLLRDAKDVVIVEVDEQGTEVQSGKHLDDVSNYLLRHKINVDAKAYLHTERRVSSEILRFAGALGAAAGQKKERSSLQSHAIN